jgi:hypothetical protein
MGEVEKRKNEKMLEYFPRIFSPVFVRFPELPPYVNSLFLRHGPCDLTRISNLAMLYDVESYWFCHRF